MIMVGAMAAALWGIGIVMRAPHAARWTMIALLLVAVMALHVILPDGHPLRAATGGDARLWGVILAFAALAVGYGRILRRLRKRADIRAAPDTPPGQLTPSELNRYARHITLREIGGPGQKSLQTARVLVIGAGGLGSPVIQYLAASGVGTLGVIDPDAVENSNLARQVIHTDARIGLPKVHSVAEAVAAQNPHVTLRPYHRALTAEIAQDLFTDYDLVIEGTDSFETRTIANAACVAAGKPLLSAAITQWEGQVSLYDPARGGPCFACVFPKAPDPALVPTCAEAGVAGPLPGVLGTLLALEAIKWITDAGAGLRGRVMLYDGLYAETRSISAQARPDCPVCQGRGLSGAAPGP